MIDPNISELEKRCIRALADAFEKGQAGVSKPWEFFASEGFSSPDPRYVALMKMLQHYEAFKKYSSVTGAQFDHIELSPQVVLVAREIDAMERQAQEPGDVVAAITEKIRRSRWLAWVVIISIVAAGLHGFVGLINGIISLGHNVGWISK